MMKRWNIPLALALVLLFAAPVLASEGGESGGVFTGDVGNVLWTLVIFALVVFVLGRFAWGPILKGLQDRETFIRTALEDAKRDRDEAGARLQEYTDKLHAARSEASAIVEEGRRDAETVKHRLVAESRVEQTAQVERAKREIALAKEAAIKDLYAAAASLVTEAASKVVRRELDARDHERLVAESIAQVAERLGRKSA
jgi:F-type H+-transporting ATPase subunit b